MASATNVPLKLRISCLLSTGRASSSASLVYPAAILSRFQTDAVPTGGSCSGRLTHNGKSMGLHRCIPSTVAGQLQPGEAIKCGWDCFSRHSSGSRVLPTSPARQTRRGLPLPHWRMAFRRHAPAVSLPGRRKGPGRVTGQVDIKGNTVTFTSRATNHSFTVDLKALQPDGSGKVVGKDEKNREFYLTFDPGSGARLFHVTNSLRLAGVFMRLRHSDVSQGQRARTALN